jgi:preprotein translocase subunit SecG
MLIILVLVVLGLVGVSVVLLQRNQAARGSRRNSYFTHTLGVADPAPPAAKDEPPAA